MRIPLIDLKSQFDNVREEVLAAVGSVCDRQAFVLGPEVEAFEKAIADYHGVSEAVGVACGTDALLLALMAVGVEAGDEVITTSYSFIAPVEAILRLGARPVFVDIDGDTLNIDSTRVDEMLTPRVKVILPVHLYGQCAEMEPLQALARDEDLRIVEDAAQAIGAKQGGRPVGQLGDIACLSFYPSKNLGAFGDGGMVLTNHPEWARKIRMLRNHGSQEPYRHELVGLNSRLDALQAAVLAVKFRYLDRWIELRRERAHDYNRLFTEAKLTERVRLPVEQAGNYHTFNHYVVRVPGRDALRNFLASNGIESRVYYPVPLHLQPCLAGLGYHKGDFPVAEQVAEEALALPLFPELTVQQQEYIVDQIRTFFAKS